MSPVAPRARGQQAAEARPGTKSASSRQGQAHEEPEILEGLARDIVSRLATTLFGEDDVPLWRDESGRTAEAVEGVVAPEVPRPEAPRVEAAPGVAEDRPLAIGAAQARRPRLVAVERPALLVRGTVRSGRKIRHNGDVCVLGDVNPGGQIVAAGDVVVMGTVRGLVHAGATGDVTAIVAAFRLSPTQLRIASYLARPPEEPGGYPEYPELASVRDGVVVLQPLQQRGS